VDGRLPSPLGLDSSGDHIRPVTQDEDDDPLILDDITHQLSRVAADSADDEQFKRLDGHTWNDDILLFTVCWKTDMTSCLPFSIVKLDFPSETAAYVLKHKLGCADGKYIGGRYTRWTHQFTRQHSKIVRRLLPDSGRMSYMDDGAVTTIRVAQHLPNGTCLIRRVIREVSKSGGNCKRKKPGRLSRPVEVKHGIQVPRTRLRSNGGQYCLG
jgi:hypothetical protein